MKFGNPVIFFDCLIYAVGLKGLFQLHIFLGGENMYLPLRKSAAIELLENYEEKLIELRREFHKIPELGYFEVKTKGKIK